MHNVFSQSTFEVRFDEGQPEWEAFQQFPMDTIQDDHESYQDSKVQTMVYMLNQAYQFTKKELMNFFTVKEAQFIVGAFVSTLHEPSFACKELLITHFEDASRFEGLDETLNLDVKEFVKKLRQLTEFQAFTVIRMAYEYLQTPDRVTVELQSRGKELIGKVFGIEDVNPTGVPTFTKGVS